MMRKLIRAVLFNDTSDENHLGSTQVIRNIHLLCKEHGIDLIGSYHRENIKSSNLGLKEKLKEAELVLINGEGTLHRSTAYIRDFLEFCRDKKFVLINTVWEKMYIKDKSLFKNALLVSVRESLSYAQIIKIVDKKKVCVVPDLIFYTNIHGLQINTGYSDSFMDYLRRGLKDSDNYFPMDFNQSSPNLGAYLSWMNNLDLYVTGRFHGVCLAAMLGKPFLAFPSNSHKVEGLLKDMNCAELLLSSFKEIEDKRQLAKKSIHKAEKYVKKARVEINQLFTKIRNKVGR